jgi:hypothetical protein
MSLSLLLRKKCTFLLVHNIILPNSVLVHNPTPLLLWLQYLLTSALVLWELTTTHLQASYHFWLTGRVKQALANQCRPWQHQCPLGWALLATGDKYADHIALVSQSKLLLSQDSSSGAHTATVNLLAATPSADSESSHLNSMGSPPPALIALRPARSHPAAEQGGSPSLAQASPLQPELHRHSSGTPSLRVMALIPHQLPHTLTVCLPSVCSSSNSNKYLLQKLLWLSLWVPEPTSHSMLPSAEGACFTRSSTPFYSK